jgi:hypothetical protein|tara:strand:- start:142 stop:285 length:144 start_codon:yes stop_codon:yes gene_type:complete
MTDWQIICFYDAHFFQRGYTFERLAILADRSVEEVKEILSEIYSSIS